MHTDRVNYTKDMDVRMVFLNFTDQPHGKKIRYHDFSPKDLQTEMVASSKSFNSALRGKKKRVVILIIGVPTLKLQILCKIITHCYGALRFSHPLADLHRY